MSDEAKLIQQFNEGNKDALCQIYQRHKNDLYGFAMSLLHDAAAAEDAVHDVFVGFAKKSGSFTLKGKLRSYLLTSVANRARDLWHRKSNADVSIDQAPALPSRPAHQHRLAPQRRVIQHLHRRVKGVHIHMQNGSIGFHADIIIHEIKLSSRPKVINCGYPLSIHRVQVSKNLCSASDTDCQPI